MKFSGRRQQVVIKQWYRTIGDHNYKFIITYHPDGSISYQVWQRNPKLLGQGYAEIHRWTRQRDGSLDGIYRRSNRLR